MQLEHGATYQGAVDLPWPISSLATRAAAVSYLEARGWDDVQVWEDPGELPPDWPHTGRQGDFFARARWGGPSGPSALPDAVLWAAPVPAPAAGPERPPRPAPAPSRPLPPPPPFQPDFRRTEKAVAFGMLAVGFTFSAVRASLALARARRR